MTPPATVASSGEPTGRQHWRLAGVLVLLLVAAYCVQTGSTSESRSAAGPDKPTERLARVTLTIRRPGAEDRVVEVDHRDGMTVADATRAAVASRWRGDGELLFLEALDGVASQPSEGLYWQFEVNDQYAQLGAGSTDLAPGDRVLWTLAAYE